MKVKMAGHNFKANVAIGKFAREGIIPICKNYLGRVPFARRLELHLNRRKPHVPAVA